MILVARLGGLPNAVDREVIKEQYRTGRRPAGWVGDRPEWLDEEEESEEGSYVELYFDEGLKELELFSLKGGIDPKVIAEKIVAHAKQIYKFIALNAKDHARRRAMARKREALARNTPTPTN